MHHAMHQAGQSPHKGHYGRLIAMVAVSFIAMYILMYAMVDAFGNVYNSVNQAYMAGLTFRTVSVEKAARALQEGKIAGAVQTSGRLVVPARQAVNAVLEFID